MARKTYKTILKENLEIYIIDPLSELFYRIRTSIPEITITILSFITLGSILESLSYWFGYQDIPSISLSLGVWLFPLITLILIGFIFLAVAWLDYNILKEMRGENEKNQL